MAEDLRIVRRISKEGQERGHDGYMIFCPGCKHGHLFTTAHPSPAHPTWKFDGNMERPTFEPSMLATWIEARGEPDEKNHVCHSFVKDGQIQFLGDCTHELANKTVPLEPF